MKKLVLGLAAASAMVGSPAFAQSADYAVSGTVTATCYANADGTIPFGTIDIDSTTGLLVAGQDASSTPQTVWCNGINSTLAFTGSSISTANTTNDSNFTSTLDFTPKVSVDGTDFATGATVGAVYGPMIVTAENLVDGGLLPVAGDYTGTITVTLTPSA